MTGFGFRISCLLILFALLMLPGPNSIAQTSSASSEAPQSSHPPSSLRSALEAVERAEAFEAGSPGETSNPFNPSQSKIPRQLKEASKKIDTYLERHPQDISALLLAVRAGRALAIFDLTKIEGGNLQEQIAAMERKDREQNNRLQGYCDRALAVDSGSAEAYYWKARLYGLNSYVVREGQIRKEPLNLTEAIRMAQEAVKLAPANVAYREALASYLLLANRDKEAMEAVQEIAGGQHPIYLLLKDRRAIPLPPEAAPLPELANTFVEVMMAPVGLSYPFLRVQAYVLPISAEEAQAFWRRSWPGFQLLQAEEKIETTADGGKMTQFVQWMRWRGDELYPASAMHGVLAQGFPKEGVVIRLTELRNVRPENGGYKIPIPVGDVYCIVQIHNFRTS